MTRLGRSRCSRALALSVALTAACGGTTEPQTPPLGVAAEIPERARPARTFAFVTLDGQAVTSTAYRGRMTLVGFAATYDLGSHALARFMNEVFARHTPRINALLLVLEPRDHEPMVQAFAGTLDLRYDVVHADEATTAGQGPFPGLHHVPSVVLLDRRGREVWRHLGLVTTERLHEVIEEHDERAR